MKLTSLILIFLTLMLNIVPCCAWENSDESDWSKLNSEKNIPIESEDDCKNCSPFYSCGNCLASLDIPIRLNINLQTTPTSPNFNLDLLLSFTAGETTGIWQPPKKI